MAARIKRIYHPDEVREKIKTSQLVNRLNLFVMGEIDMLPHQVTAALGLIKKVMPDLSSTEHSGHMTVKTVCELSDAELTTIAQQNSDTIQPKLN